MTPPWTAAAVALLLAMRSTYNQYIAGVEKVGPVVVLQLNVGRSVSTGGVLLVPLGVEVVGVARGFTVKLRELLQAV
jgi:hypothetical protein